MSALHARVLTSMHGGASAYGCICTWQAHTCMYAFAYPQKVMNRRMCASMDGRRDGCMDVCVHAQLYTCCHAGMHAWLTHGHSVTPDFGISMRRLPRTASYRGGHAPEGASRTQHRIAARAARAATYRVLSWRACRQGRVEDAAPERRPCCSELSSL
eukprot:219999-Chlamydomonas_euryale.AAC.3